MPRRGRARYGSGRAVSAQCSARHLCVCVCVCVRACVRVHVCERMCVCSRAAGIARLVACTSAHRARTARYGPVGAPAQTEGCGDDRAMKRAPIRMCVRCIERAVNHAAAAEAASRPGTAASCSMGCGGSLCRDMLHGVTLQRVAQREPVRGFATVAPTDLPRVRDGAPPAA